MTGSSLSKQVSGVGAMNSSQTSFNKRQTEKETRAAKTQIGFGLTQPNMQTTASQVALPEGNTTPCERFSTAVEPLIYAAVE
jgi:hypothetical protein